MRAFAKIDLGREPAPDETTVCKFRHLLERHGLGPKILHEINDHLAKAGVKVSRGTIVDATIIHAPSSTKNSDGKRDPEMHQTMKGNEWHLGMKAHIGVDSKSRIVHSFVATPANTHDSRVLPELLHGAETRVWGDSAYRGQTAVIRSQAPHAADFTARGSARRKNISDREREIHRTNSGCEPEWSMCSTSSSGSSGFRKSAIAASRRTHIAWSSTSRSPICTCIVDDRHFEGCSFSRNQRSGPRSSQTRSVNRGKPLNMNPFTDSRRSARSSSEFP